MILSTKGQMDSGTDGWTDGQADKVKPVCSPSTPLSEGYDYVICHQKIIKCHKSHKNLKENITNLVISYEPDDWVI